MFIFFGLQSISGQSLSLGPELSLTSNLITNQKSPSQLEPALVIQTLYGKKWVAEFGASYWTGKTDSAGFIDEYKLLKWRVNGGIFIPLSLKDGVKIMAGWNQARNLTDVSPYTTQYWNYGMKWEHKLSLRAFIEFGISRLQGYEAFHLDQNNSRKSFDLNPLKWTFAFMGQIF